jgi:hypothetical protein
MLFFRSEDHLKNWTRFDPNTEGGISTLEGMVALFSHDLFINRSEPDYFSNFQAYRRDFFANIGKMKGIGNFMKS